MSTMKRSPSIIDWMPEFYDSLSSRYDLLARFLFPIGEKGRWRVVADLKPGSILEVACGTGMLLQMAQIAGVQCFGIDNSPGMLAQAQEKVPAAQFLRASFYEIPYPDATFDYVVETNAVSGVDIDVESVLREMVRVCKENGQILIGDYAKASNESWSMHALEKIGQWIGDYAYDYAEIFDRCGYAAESEELGWGGMYQFIRVLKKPIPIIAQNDYYID